MIAEKIKLNLIALCFSFEKCWNRSFTNINGDRHMSTAIFPPTIIIKKLLWLLRCLFFVVLSCALAHDSYTVINRRAAIWLCANHMLSIAFIVHFDCVCKNIFCFKRIEKKMLLLSLNNTQKQFSTWCFCCVSFVSHSSLFFSISVSVCLIHSVW